LTPRLKHDFQELSRQYPIAYDDQFRTLEIQGVPLGVGFNQPITNVLIQIPRKYPLDPPGIGKSGIYFPYDLRYHGKQIKDFWTGGGPLGNPNWAWFCYVHIEWNPNHDNLCTLLGRIMADLHNRGETFDLSHRSTSQAPGFLQSIRNLLAGA
jgi:hypothetical protein